MARRVRRASAGCIVKRATYSASDPAASAALVNETRATLLHSTASSVVSSTFASLGYEDDDVQSRFDSLLPEARSVAKRVRLELGWTRSECTTISRLLGAASDAHAASVDLPMPSLFDSESNPGERPSDRCARLRVRWLRLVVDGDRVDEVMPEDERDKLRQRALASLRRESKHTRSAGDWHKLDAVLDDVLRDLRSRCEGSEATMHEIERWMDWLDRFVLPLVAVRSKSLSLAKLDDTTLALLDAMRASVSNASSTNTSDALRAWVRAGMPDTASQ